MKYTYKDKNGKEIQAGMKIRHDSGEIEQVHATTDAFGNESLGICATNPDYAKRHPECEIEYYSLSNFNMKEWEIVE